MWLSATEGSGTLRVPTTASVRRLYVSPLLPEFLLAHPRLRVSIDLSDQTLDLVSAGFDLAIRIGALEDSALVACKLASTRRVLCAAPDSLRRPGAPQTPEDLARHECILLYGSQAIRSASCRERVSQYVYVLVVAVSSNNTKIT